MRQLAAIALLLVGRVAFGSPSDACSPISTVKDAQVTITIPDGRTSFREGEIIPLALSFTSTGDKRYWADNRNYDRSGRLSIEAYCVEPEARDPLADYFRVGAFMGGRSREHAAAFRKTIHRYRRAERVETACAGPLSAVRRELSRVASTGRRRSDSLRPRVADTTFKHD